MHRPWLVALSLLAGCDAVFGLGEPGASDAGPIVPGDDGAPKDGQAPDGQVLADGGTPDALVALMCERDPFDSNLPAWVTGYLGACSSSTCSFGVVGGRRVARLGAAGGLGSNFGPAVDFRDGTVSVDAFPTTTPSSTSQLRVAMSSTEILGVGISTDVSGNLTLVANHSTPSSSSTAIIGAYDPTLHRGWRIAHVVDAMNAAKLVISTRAAGSTTWVARLSVPAPAVVTTTRAQLDVQRTTYATSAEGDVIAFDDFELCAR